MVIGHAEQAQLPEELLVEAVAHCHDPDVAAREEGVVQPALHEGVVLRTGPFLQHEGLFEVADPHLADRTEILQPHVDVLELRDVLCEVVLHLEKGPIVDRSLEEEPRAAELDATSILGGNARFDESIAQPASFPDEGRVEHDPAPEPQIERAVAAGEPEAVVPLELPLRRVVTGCGRDGRRLSQVARPGAERIVPGPVDGPGVQQDAEDLPGDRLAARRARRGATRVVGPGNGSEPHGGGHRETHQQLRNSHSHLLLHALGRSHPSGSP